MGCSAWNGEEDEGVKAVQEMRQQVQAESQAHPISGSEKENVESTGTSGTSDIQDNDSSEAESGDDEGEYSSEKAVKVKPRKGRPKSNRNKT